MANDPADFDDEAPEERHCERCKKLRLCELIPMHGFSLYLCEHCAAAAYRAGDAV